MRPNGFFRIALAPILLCLSTSYGKVGYQIKGEQPLKLTLAQVNQKYCRATETTDVLHLGLQLTFTNVSQSNVILYRGSNAIVRTIVSKTLYDASRETHELDASATVLESATSTQSVGTRKPNDAFAVLPPNGAFQTTASVSLEVSRSSKSPSFALRPGAHVLQIVVSTWPRRFDSPKTMAARWISTGMLWYKHIVSEHLILEVDEHREIENCARYEQLFSRARSDPNAIEEESGVTALMAAIDAQEIDIFNDLLARGADVNAAARGGMTALVVAASTEGIFLRRLVESGANCNIRTLFGQTPLSQAIDAGIVENVKLLIDCGANLNLRDEKGRSPLQLAKELAAARKFYREIGAQIVDLLKAAGAKD